MKKKVFSIVLTALLAATLFAGCGNQATEATPTPTPAPTATETAETTPAPMTAGTYKATAAGFYGDFDVSVTVDETSIVSIDVGENSETLDVGQKALSILADRMKQYNTAGVDVVTGATMTSIALRTAVTDCLEQAGAPDSLLAAPIVEKSAEQTIDTGVLVIGGGGAGLSAAITAAEGGAKVTLIEKQDLLGGNTILSAGIVYAALDEADIPVMVDYYMERANQNADRDMLTFFAENSMDTIAFLEDAGVQWAFTAPAGTAAEARAHFSVNITGATIINALIAKAESLDVTIMTGVAGNELILDGNGAVVGAKATSSTGDYVFNASAVVLATGGFDASTEMKEQYSPSSAQDFPLSNKGNVGDGIRMGLAAGADTVFKGGVIGFICLDATLSNSGQSGIAMASKCFTKQDGTYLGMYVDYPIAHTLIKQDGEDFVYGLMDSSAATADAPGNTSGEAAVTLGYGYKGDTLEALATANGMDVAKLTDAAAQAGLSVGPFYAVKVVATTIGSMGGLKIDTKAQVLNKDGIPIAGLYAAGEVANGDLFNIEYPASGSSISMSITFGRMAGTNAAEYIK